MLVNPDELLALAPPAKQRRGAATFSRVAKSADETKLRALLSFIPSDDRDIWLRIGMALHSGGHRRLWDEWSSTSDKFDPITQDKTWNAFRSGRGITLGTVFYEARTRGWRWQP